MPDHTDEIDLAAWLDGMSAVVGLKVPTIYRDGVLLNLRVIAIHAKLVDEFPLDDRQEPASIYRA